jgi:tripartite-type tricarboxylate transporter receptor subunit TctC
MPDLLPMLCRFTLLACALLAAPAAAQTSAPAPTFDRPIRIIVPIAPGGGTDVFARLLAELAGPALGQPVVVENRPGASSTLGTQALVESRPDGQTLAFVPNAPLTSSPHVLNVRYTLDQIEPMFVVGHTGFTLCVRPDSPLTNATQLVAALRAAPAGRFTYGTDGVGGNMHLAAERVFRRLGVELTMVPFQGAAQTLTSFLSGQIDLYGGSIAVVMATAKEGRARCLLLTQAEDHPDLPNASGLRAVGIPEEETLIWWGMIAPRGLPPERRALLLRAFQDAWASERFQAQLARQGVTPRFRGPEEMDRLMREESEQLGRAARAAGIERAAAPPAR